VVAVIVWTYWLTYCVDVPTHITDISYASSKLLQLKNKSFIDKIEHFNGVLVFYLYFRYVS